MAQDSIVSLAATAAASVGCDNERCLEEPARVLTTSVEGIPLTDGIGTSASELGHSPANIGIRGRIRVEGRLLAFATPCPGGLLVGGRTVEEAAWVKLLIL